MSRYDAFAAPTTPVFCPGNKLPKFGRRKAAISDQLSAVSLNQRQKANGGHTRIHQDELPGRLSVRTVVKGGVFPCYSVQQHRSGWAVSVKGYQFPSLPLKWFTEKPAPRRAAPFFFALFLGRSKKKGKGIGEFREWGDCNA